MKRGGSAALAFCFALAAGCSGMTGGGSAGPVDTDTPLPPEFATKTNPLPADAATIARGHELFLKNCSPCHGVNADGKGPASVGLIPPPANFHDGVRLSSHGDAWVFLRMAKGKKDTAMPAFSGTLSEDDRWAILRFLRSIPGAEHKEPK